MLTVENPGAGRIGAVHAAAISAHPGSRLAAVSDLHAQAAEGLAARFGCAGGR
jgi:myo-inositol 2-dehydrogenase/D-chiro-inositol 1-dehydrogenase